MVHAIAERHRIDEVKDLRDKAMALEVYTRQAQHVEAERKAPEVRLRAERRLGELVQQEQEAGRLATAKGEVNPGSRMVSSPSTPSTLADLGIPRDRSARAQATPADARRSGGHAKADTSNGAMRQPTPYAAALDSAGLTRQTHAGIRTSPRCRRIVSSGTLRTQ